MFVTYEKWQKVSVASHDHATIWFDKNTLRIRSVDTKRSVATRWDAIGKIVSYVGVRFTEDSEATRLIATQMEREGWRILGLKPNWERHEGAIIKLVSDGIRTNPETLMGRCRDRNVANVRARAQKFGAIGTADVSAMRAAILARQAAR